MKEMKKTKMKRKKLVSESRGITQTRRGCHGGRQILSLALPAPRAAVALLAAALATAGLAAAPAELGFGSRPRTVADAPGTVS
jgi:hypothetical protein